MFDIQYVGDVEWAVLRAAAIIHDLGVYVARRWHHHHVPTLLGTDKRCVSYLPARQEEEELRAQGIRS